MDKEQLDKLAQPIVDLYNALEMDMLTNIAERLKGKYELLETDPETWQMQQLEMLGMLDQKNINTVRSYAKLTNGQINQMMIAATLEGLEENEEALQAAMLEGAKLLVPKPITESPKIINILNAFTRQAKSILNLTNQTLISSAKQAYIDIVNKSALDVISGFKTGQQALRSTIKQWADQGIPALITKDGRKLGTEGYVRMVITSTMNNATNQMQDDRIEEYGVGLIEVSSHAGNRPGCQPYAGRIFSLKPDHPKYKYLYDPKVGRIGAPDSLFGINCGHKKYPFIEGISERTYKPNKKADDNKVYEESQQQRKYERDIRKLKTREEMFKAAGDVDAAKEERRKIRAKQDQLTKFLDATGRTRRRYREQIVKGGVQDNKNKVKSGSANNLPPEAKDAFKNKPANSDIEDIMKDIKIPKKKPTPKPKPTPEPEIPTTKELDISTFKRITESSDDVLRDAKTIRDLPQEKRKSIKEYTSSFYQHMNNWLRFGKDKDQKVIDIIDTLKETIDESSKGLSEDTMLFRFIETGATKHIFGQDVFDSINNALILGEQDAIDKVKASLIGGALEDKAFVSSTYMEGSFGGGNGINIKILAPKGYKGGLFVESVSMFADEREYLFNAGTKFDIVDVEFENPIVGRRKITLIITPK